MLFALSEESLLTQALVFVAAAVVIGIVGIRLAALADRLSMVTRLGQALIGAMLLGATTSLPGIITSVAAAAGGHPTLAISNAIGGIAAQTAFLTIADFAYRQANLEHAAASAANLINGALLVSLLAIPLAAMAAPEVALWQVSPASALILLAYMKGQQIALAVHEQPMWRPRRTVLTTIEDKDPVISDTRRGPLIAGVLALAAITGSAGLVLTESAIALADTTGIGEQAVGGVMTAIVTSLPELVTSVAAVRRGAPNLAVGGILGGNAFDVLFLAFADIAYRDGSIYHAFTSAHVFVIAVTILMTGVLMVGLLRREEQGPAGIGFESTTVLALYAVSVFIMVTR